MAGTVGDFIAQLEARLGHPYSETLDGGVGPTYYDCSGLVDVCANAIGIPYTRSTYTQWADDRYEHLPANTPLVMGDVVYMHVSGEADPGHVGVAMGNGQYINAPHSGAVVRIEPISYTSSEHPFGVIRLPFGSTPTPPPPTPKPIGAWNMQCDDPTSGGYWDVGSDGHIEAGGGAPYLGGLANNRFNWQATGQVSGISPRINYADLTWGYDIAVLRPAAAADGTWFAHYFFPRNGSLKEAS